MMHVIVLAGGGGTRLWPLSTEDFPKQFLNFGDQESLLQKTTRRFLDSDLTQNLIVSTNEHYQVLVAKQLEKLDRKQKVQIVVEPTRRNTAAAIALSVKYLLEKRRANPTDLVLVLPSDHLIQPEAVFMRYVEHACAHAISQSHIMTFGIKPSRPETGFGYIQMGKKFDPFIHEAGGFFEKPSFDTACQFVRSGQYVWNSGIFLFSIATMMEELADHVPEIYQGVCKPFDQVISSYDQFPDVSIDYALMEKTHHLAVCPLPVEWSDVGSWDSVYEILDKDQDSNVKIGNVLAIDTKNSLIFGGKRLISTLGLEDLLIVETENALFIGKKGESQKIKTLVRQVCETPKEKP